MYHVLIKFIGQKADASEPNNRTMSSATTTIPGCPPTQTHNRANANRFGVLTATVGGKDDDSEDREADHWLPNTSSCYHLVFWCDSTKKPFHHAMKGFKRVPLIERISNIKGKKDRLLKI